MDGQRISGGTQGELQFGNEEGNSYQKTQEEVIDSDRIRVRKWIEPLMGKEWFDLLEPEFHKPYMKHLGVEIARQREILNVYPEKDKVFEAFKLTPYSKVKAVIIGQDPYHNGKAIGVSFGNAETDRKKISPSLLKIFEYLDMAYEIGYLSFPPLYDYTLSRWTDQGVLLLNRVLTVQKGKANSHKDIGWEQFTDKVIHYLNMARRRIVFLLWGHDAKKIGKLVDTKKHYVLFAEHPAAACYAKRMWQAESCFMKANEFFETHGEKKILW